MTKLIQIWLRNATFQANIDNDLKTNQIRLGKAAIQGDIISPKLLTPVLENVFNNLLGKLTE